MKEQLEQIYRELSGGGLTREKALDKIRAIKTAEPKGGVGSILAVPSWEPSIISGSTDTAGRSNRTDVAADVVIRHQYIILCELPRETVEQFDTLVSPSYYLPLRSHKESIAERYEEYALACFTKLRSILERGPEGAVLVQVVIGGEGESELLGGLSGLLKTASLENPNVWGQLVMVDSGTGAGELAGYLQENQARPHEAVIRYSQGVRYVQSWREVSEASAPALAFKEHGVYLISGGLGGLGVLFAREILSQSTGSRVILTGRSAPGPAGESVLAELGDRVEYRQADVADAEQVDELLVGIERGHGGVSGIIHAAGVIADNFILKKDEPEFARVLEPKVQGTVNLDRASRHLDLDFLVLFSSAAGVLGNLGQCDYAAANGFMDRYAAYRNALVTAGHRRGHTLSVNWPLWRDGGMDIDPASQRMLQQTLGMAPMSRATGVQAFHQSLVSQYGQALVMEGELARMRQRLFAVEPVAAPAQPAPDSEPEVPAEALVDQARQYLGKLFAAQLKLPAQEVDPYAPFEHYGIDSILAMDLTSRLEQDFGSLPKTLFFEYQSLAELSDYMVRTHGSRLASLVGESAVAPARSRPSPSSPLPSPSPVAARGSRRRFSRRAEGPSGASKAASEPIAIIGLSGRYPQARDLAEYWSNLRAGRDCITEVPTQRWDWRAYYSEAPDQAGAHTSKWGGFIAGVDEFDPRFFNIAPREAPWIDPQERLFLEHSWMAVEDAGYSRAALQGPEGSAQVGVYAGVMYGEYNLSGSLASIANRVSYILNLHGPSLTVDTMCSSSLTAIHLACQDLKQGRTDLALAGGVNVSIHPNKYTMLSAGQFISSEGQCQSFGEGGDGYIPGEGVGVAVLKRLSEAERSGDHIYALIQGSALNHGGKTNGYTVPNPQAQAAAISRALDEAGVNAAQLSYLEAHGTGTKLGDPIEIAALSQAFGRHTQASGFCRIGSVKSNIGHCESAAGIAGLSKVVLQLQHRELVPSLHAERLNPNIDFERSPFVVNRQLSDWSAPVIEGRTIKRLAGVSSFGAGGSNAHVVVEEYPAPAVSTAQRPGPVAVPLSARTADQLTAKAQDLLRYVDSGAEVDLASVGYTLQVGREAMEHRVGFLVSSAGQLAERLRAYVDGRVDIEDCYQGQVKRNKDGLVVINQDDDMKEAIDKWISRKKFIKLLDLWTKGLDLDWNKLYEGTTKPRRISLPAYPFARERYWTDALPSVQPVNAGPIVQADSGGVLHPLLHRNTSDFSQQSYCSVFTGDESFLNGHQTSDETGRKVLPETVYPEMVRAAIDAACSGAESGILELHNVVWTEPVVIAGNTRVNIALFTGDNERIDYEIYSGEQGRESVHCQGHGVFTSSPAPDRLDITRLKEQMTEGATEGSNLYSAFDRAGLHFSPSYQGIVAVYRGEEQLLADLHLSDAAFGEQNDYILHPGVMSSAFQAGMVLFGGVDQSAFLPFSVSSLRIFSACSDRMWAWLRPAGAGPDGGVGASVDMDLCDAQGNVCVQLRGVGYRSAGVSAEPVVSPEHSTGPWVGRPVSIGGAGPLAEVEAEPTIEPPGPVAAKPSGIRLIAPGALELPAAAPGGRPSVSLSPPSPSRSAPPPAQVGLYDYGQGVFSLQIDGTPADGDAELSPALVDQLVRALSSVQQAGSVKVLMLNGPSSGALSGGQSAHRAAIEQGLYRSLADFPYPVLAMMSGGARGAGLLLAALCDVMICSREGDYAWTDGPALNAGEEAFWFERLGAAPARALLWGAGESRGRDRQRQGWRCPIVPAGQVNDYGRALAQSLAAKSATALQLLKQHLSRSLVESVERFSEMAPSTDPDSPAAEAVARLSSEAIEWRMAGERVGLIRLRTTAASVEAVYEALDDLLGQLQQASACSVLVLASDHERFLPDADVDESLGLALQRLILEAPVPVIAALEGDAGGLGWLLGQCCDASVHDEQGRYSAAALLASAGLSRQASALFPRHFGAALSKELLLTGAEYTGAQLQQRQGALEVAASGQVLARALALAERRADWPQARLRQWKRHHSALIEEHLNRLPHPATEPEPGPAAGVEQATTVPLNSSVIRAVAQPDGTLVVHMEERQAKNMFSEAFMAGMAEVFEHIGQTPSYKVVVLTGYDNYFASGGTQESLVAIQQGQARFTDTKTYQLALDCPVPVIAAMQGHGIGAGWALGMFADLIVFSEESRYVSPYMRYGFTPGAGSTLVFPEKLGHDLARQTLLSADEFTGGELQARNVPMPVVSRDQVLPRAMALAGQIAHWPRHRLVALKRYWNAELPRRLESSYARELAMHEQTFVGRAETLEQIRSHFVESESAPAAPAAPAAQPAPVAEPAAASSEAESRAAVSATLRQLLARELYLDEAEIDEESQFVDLGLDSITGVTWIRKINEQYRLSIEATKVYSYPTLAQLSRYVHEQAAAQGSLAEPAPSSPSPEPVEPAEPAEPARPEPLVSPSRAQAPVALSSWRRRAPARRAAARPAPSDSEAAIAVVGMAGQFPRATTLEAFWDNLAQGKDCISEIPARRWDRHAYYRQGEAVPGKTNSKWLGALDEYDLFDPLFFTISPTEAESMDPQQRLFLQACWHSIEHAGYNAQSLSGSACGVFAGCATGDYQLLSREQQLSAQGFTGGASSILAARVSYFLNLTGPCLSIDTACSSSLVAIANACDSLRSGSSDAALAGGVYVMAGPEMHVKTAQSGMLSPQGRCHTFDQRADGFVPGEGVGVVMLKRLADAERDGDSIYGVIRGWGVNQDGKTNGITAPNAESQTRLLQNIYDTYRIDPGDIQLVEAHGTGTQLGDPIEVEGLKSSFQRYTDEQGYCALGSVKSNIGHCLTAAGIAGFIKLLLAIRHKQLPPTIHFSQLNEHISLEDSPFYINDRLQDWQVDVGRRRQAAISSFGFSGTNAHLVVAEPETPSRAEAPVEVITQGGKMLVPLSARTDDQLQSKAADLLAFIRSQPGLDLTEVAYTLQVGRQAMDERLGVLVDSLEQLADKLQAYLDGHTAIEDVHRGQARGGKASLQWFTQDVEIRQAVVEQWLAAGKLSQLASLWVQGLDFDWQRLYGSAKPRRIALPVYPFAKQRYWIEPAPAVAGSAPSVLHPLLHTNVSDLRRQGYHSRFNGSETFLDGEERRVHKPQRINLPTYPFARERCWVDGAAVDNRSNNMPKKAAKNIESIEDILNKIDDDLLETDQAVKLLKELA